LCFVTPSEQYCSYIHDQHKITNNKTSQLDESVLVTWLFMQFLFNQVLFVSPFSHGAHHGILMATKTVILLKATKGSLLSNRTVVLEKNNV
jgi:hypothetical protein